MPAQPAARSNAAARPVKPAREGAPAGGQRPPVQVQPSAVRPAPRAGGARATTKPPAQPAQSAPPPARKLSPEAEATVARDLDLFGITRAPHACACPDCRHELTNVQCLGRKLRACLHCKGVWLPLGLVSSFEKDGAWIHHLGPALQAAIQQLARK